jgi:hypothetical protein
MVRLPAKQTFDTLTHLNKTTTEYVIHIFIIIIIVSLILESLLV